VHGGGEEPKRKLSEVGKSKEPIKVTANYAGCAQAACQIRQIRQMRQLRQRQAFGRQLTVFDFKLSIK